jgi:hypothetical protein
MSNTPDCQYLARVLAISRSLPASAGMHPRMPYKIAHYTHIFLDRLMTDYRLRRPAPCPSQTRPTTNKKVYGGLIGHLQYSRMLINTIISPNQ